MAGGRFAHIRTQAITEGQTNAHLKEVMRKVQERTIVAVATKVREMGYKGIAFDIEQMAREL